MSKQTGDSLAENSGSHGVKTTGGLPSEGSAQLERLNRLAAMGTLSAGVAHEIKNALVPVKTLLDLLLEQHPNSELADIVRREVGRINVLVAQMLKLAGPNRPDMAPVSLRKVIEDTLHLLHHQASLRSVSFQCQFQALDDQVLGDASQIEQAFLNLLINALEAVPERGTVTVRTRVPEKGRVEVEISDDGKGISVPDQARLFQPFFTTKEGGTGLGLSITRDIMTAHGGSIRVESCDGKGATFRLCFPSCP